MCTDNGMYIENNCFDIWIKKHFFFFSNVIACLLIFVLKQFLCLFAFIIFLLVLLLLFVTFMSHFFKT